MTRGMNYTGVYSRRKLGRAFDWLVEVAKMVLTLAFIVAGLSIALWSVLGINPFRR